jgi:hypothetical protein
VARSGIGKPNGCRSLMFVFGADGPAASSGHVLEVVC